jgi:hypothetical protein
MQRRVFGERATVPELDAFMTEFADPIQSTLAARLSDGLDRSLVALALDFWTWQRLDREGPGRRHGRRADGPGGSANI